MVERYAHLIKTGHQNEIRRFLGLPLCDERVTDTAGHLSSA